MIEGTCPSILVCLANWLKGQFPLFMGSVKKVLIQNESKLPSLSINENHSPLKEGGTYNAIVKEKFPNNQALIQIKGQEMKVKVDGGLPNTGKVLVQVTDMKQELPVVKAAANEVKANQAQSTKPPQQAVLPNGVKQAVQLLQDNQIPITKETINHIKTYMEKGPGTLEEKLGTIGQMASKKLDFTPAQIKAVHESLHGKPLGHVLQDITSELDPDYKSQQRQQDSLKGQVAEVLAKLEQFVKDPAKSAIIQQLSKALQQGDNPQNVAKELLNNMSAELKNNPQLAKIISNVLQATVEVRVPTSNVITAHASESIIQQAAKQIKTVPNLSQVIQFLENSAAQDEWTITQKEALQTAIGKAEQYQSAGRELAARQELATALSQLETQQPQQTQTEEAETTYRFNSDILAAVPVASRDLIVTTISKKLSQAALDFKAVQRDIRNALQTTESLIKQTPLQARPPLEAAIKQLDQAILKSDFMLYTDMGTEKKLLQASSQLHEARKLLAKGEVSKAGEIVHQVRTTVEKLMFKPSDVRMKHYVSKEMLNQEQPTLGRQLTNAVEEPLQALRQEPTARHALEYMRSLGLSYDSDIAHRLVAGESAKADADTTLKNLLMKLAQTEGNNQTGQKAEQALQNLTGQQLMSKSDSTGLQTMLFSLPIVLQDQVENVKVFLKSNNSGQKIDWENCSLYFLLETKKMGDVGIMLTAVDRTLSLTLKNDQQGFKERMQPLAEKAKGRLEEIGYKIGTLQFTALSETAEPAKKIESKKQPAFTERGYDFSV